MKNLGRLPGEDKLGLWHHLDKTHVPCHKDTTGIQRLIHQAQLGKAFEVVKDVMMYP